MVLISISFSSTLFSGTGPSLNPSWKGLMWGALALPFKPFGWVAQKTINGLVAPVLAQVNTNVISPAQAALAATTSNAIDQFNQAFPALVRQLKATGENFLDRLPAVTFKAGVAGAGGVALTAGTAGLLYHYGKKQLNHVSIYHEQPLPVYTDKVLAVEPGNPFVFTKQFADLYQQLSDYTSLNSTLPSVLLYGESGVGKTALMNQYILQGGFKRFVLSTPNIKSLASKRSHEIMSQLNTIVNLSLEYAGYTGTLDKKVVVCIENIEEIPAIIRDEIFNIFNMHTQRIMLVCTTRSNEFFVSCGHKFNLCFAVTVPDADDCRAYITSYTDTMLKKPTILDAVRQQQSTMVEDMLKKTEGSRIYPNAIKNLVMQEISLYQRAHVEHIPVEQARKNNNRLFDRALEQIKKADPRRKKQPTAA